MAAFILLLLTSPILLAAMIAIKIDTSGPIFFRQERAGKHGKPFRIYKLRTMTDKPRKSIRQTRAGDPEVTKIGHYLRRYKLDELVQLINVIKGDMSLVGPRPCLISHIPRLNADGKERLRVRPGLTGLAQVNGNIHLSWPERWIYDRKYVERQSFLLDMEILLRTVAIVVQGEEKFINHPDA